MADTPNPNDPTIDTGAVENPLDPAASNAPRPDAAAPSTPDAAAPSGDATAVNEISADEFDAALNSAGVPGASDMPADNQISADEIEAAMARLIDSEKAAEQPEARDAADMLAAATDGAVQANDVEAAMAAMLEQGPDAPAEAAPASASPPAPPINAANSHDAAAPFAAPEFGQGDARGEVSNISLLDDVDLDVRIELGRTEMYIEDVLRLGVGSVVELNKLAGDPVDILVNDRLVARGEVLVLNDNFCVRINDIVSQIPEPEDG